MAIVTAKGTPHRPPRPAPAPCPCIDRQEAGSLWCPKDRFGDPSVPDSAPGRMSPQAAPPQGGRTGYFQQHPACRVPALCPGWLLTHSLCPAPLGLEGQREETLSVTLAQLWQAGEQARPAWLPLTWEFFHRHHVRRFGLELEKFGALGRGRDSSRGAHSLER